MKRFFIAITVKEVGREYDRFYAYVMPVSSCENLTHKLWQIKGLVSATIMETKKQARAAVAAWNKTWKAEDRYLFMEEWEAKTC